MKHYRKTLEIPADEICKYENLLASENVNYEDEKIPEYATIKKWTIQFADGCFADIKINSNSRADGDFFSEAVLFDKNGSQIDFSECQYDLAGRWILQSRTADYTINIVAA